MERRQGNGIYALIGAAAMVVGSLFGTLCWSAPGNGQSVTATPQPAMSGGVKAAESAAVPEAQPSPAASPSGKPAEQAETGPAARDASVSEQNEPPVAASDEPRENKPRPETPPPAPEKPVDPKALPPGLDHVRIEPNGENVFAGRVTPGATVEMVLGGDVYARAVADTSGLFAVIAPPLPVGASHIYLRSIAPDGQRETSRQSVTVVINRDKTRRPLVVLASRDKPTVVLSNPDSPDKNRPDMVDEAHAVSGGKPGAVRPEVRIAAIEARDGGRLNVTAQAAPGATVKLYINNVMVAPGGADSEGRLSFAISRGMEPGEYQVRLDDVDPVSGQVKSKAELSFTIPHADSPPGSPLASEVAGSPAGPEARPSGAETARVGDGDSLWRISERHYGSGRLYRDIYDANMRKIKDPDMIYPGQLLILPPVEPPKP